MIKKKRGQQRMTESVYIQNVELGPGGLLVAGAAAYRTPLVPLERPALVATS